MSVQEVADRVGALARRIRDEESLCSKFNCQTALTSDLDEENILFYAKRLTESERADAAALSLLITYPESIRITKPKCQLLLRGCAFIARA